MTLHIVDVSRHQVERLDPLDLIAAKNVGMGAVNIQLDRGRQDDVLPAWARTYADRAGALGMGISTYRWLDNRISGRDSARRAYDRMISLGGPAGMAHVVDCEDNATQQNLRDYVHTITELLGRPVAVYSGAWWMLPRAWQVADLTPYLWSAPGAGYLGSYPGDDSPHWTAGYGGWPFLAAMQYAVQPLPGTGNCSLSAIRDPGVWAALTGTEVPVPTYAQLQAERWYNEELVTPEFAALFVRLRAALGVPAANVGSKGDNKHLNGGHRSQAWIENSRYCTNRTYATEAGLNAEEKRYLSAFDVTPNTREQMLRISQNIDRVTRAGQLEEVVEWFGNTNDDIRVDGWDNIRNAVATSDSSHLWHLHGRLKRKSMRDAAVMDRVFNAIINGTSTPQGDDDMIKVIAVPRKDQVHYLGLIAGGRPVPIGTGEELEQWRALARQSLQPTDLTIPAELWDAAFGESIDVPPGGEQLAAVVAAAVDSRIDAIARAVVDEDHKRSAE